MPKRTIDIAHCHHCGGPVKGGICKRCKTLQPQDHRERGNVDDADSTEMMRRYGIVGVGLIILLWIIMQLAKFLFELLNKR